VNTGNEEVKILKELRILFSNKRNSRAMKILMIVFGFFFLLLIGLGCNIDNIKKFLIPINSISIEYDK